MSVGLIPGSPCNFAPSSSKLTGGSNLRRSTVLVMAVPNCERSSTRNVNFYDLLGISSMGSFLEIKQAYREMALKYHPDVSPPEKAEENTRRFMRVQEAYETLMDPRRRELYDRDLKRGFEYAGRKRGDESLEVKSEWRNRWQSQVEELRRRSIEKESEENLSWGARMRRPQAESSAE